MFNKRLYFYSLFTAGATLLLIAAGGLVTSTGSGLSVPDWPLSYGRFFPPMVGGIRFEHSHRMIAAFVGFCTFGLSIWLWRAEGRPFMRALAVTASLAVLLQAVLGGITVRYLLPVPVSVAHACLGQTFFCLLCLIALFLSREWRQAPVARLEGSASFFRLSCTTTAFVYAQLVAGAVVRHTGAGIATHLFLAFFIVVHVVFLNIRLFRNAPPARKLAALVVLLSALVLCQLFLGLSAYILKYLLEKGVQPRLAEVLFATAHQTVGAAILASLFVLCFRSRRLFAGPDAVGSAEFLELMKPRVTLTALATTLAGYLLAVDTPPDMLRLFHTLLGAFLVGAGGNALNQYYERDADSLMPRTQKRPLPSRRLGPGDALWFGWPVAFLGLAELALFVSPASSLIGLAILLSYLFLYTPLKRVTPLNTYVGALPGALPSFLGWVAAGGGADAGALALFLILFIWQLPHFFAIAWVYKKDYELGGFHMLSLKDADGKETAFQIVLFSALLCAAALLPYRVGLSGRLYLFTAGFASLVFLFLAVRLRAQRLRHVKGFATASIVYLFTLIIFLVADKTW